MRRRFLGIIAAILMICGTIFVAQPTYAAGCKTEGDFLGFKPWYDGYCEGGEIKEIKCNDDTCKELTDFTWTVILNISFDLSYAAGMIAVAMVIWSGFLYVMAQGDVGKLASAKKAMLTAIIGVIITMGASVIVNTVKVAFGITAGAQDSITTEQVQGAFNWAYGVSGLVAGLFVIKNGIDYMTSTGDPSKTQKATRGLIFSLVGLIIIIFASVITSFITSTVSGAM